MIINYYKGDMLCSKIFADINTKMVSVENYTACPLYMAFGINEKPTWHDFEEFIESRCFPRNRHRIKLNLEALGLTEYNPIEICKKTNGRKYEDNMWLTIEDNEKPLVMDNSEVER